MHIHVHVHVHMVTKAVYCTLYMYATFLLLYETGMASIIGLISQNINLLFQGYRNPRGYIATQGIVVINDY